VREGACNGGVESKNRRGANADRRKTCGTDPKWGSEEEREELADALEELADHAVVMRDTLREEE
jgi:hypothetical protein